MEAVSQDVDQEAANELSRRQPHDLHPVAALDTVVLPAEPDRLGMGADEAGGGAVAQKCQKSI